MTSPLLLRLVVVLVLGILIGVGLMRFLPDETAGHADGAAEDVHADELPPGGKGLKIETRLNGTTMQSSNTDNFMFPVAESLVYLTEGMTLEPGDILFTGTPSGVGHARKPEPVWMKAGDTAEVEIEGIGVLKNPIEDEKV